MTDLPSYYFRMRDRGAAVFRVDTQNRQRRIELNEIAFVNVQNGKIRPHGDTKLNADDMAEIHTWLEERRALNLARERDQIAQTIDQLNMAAHWAQTRANEALLDEVTDPLLLAMHDLRTVLVRRKAERLSEVTANSEADNGKE